MLHAVSFALVDSLNVLLIGVIVALGVMLPPAAPYRRIATLVVGGDWLGVLVLSVVTMLAFDGLGDAVTRALESPVFAIVLIAIGVLTLVLTLRSKPGAEQSQLLNRMVGPLTTPSAATFGLGFLLGVIQSATSAPFFTGLAYLSAGDYSAVLRYVGLIFYASLALSLPALSAVFVGLVRAYPNGAFGSAMAAMRERKATMAKAAGYLVAAVLILFGASLLL